MKSLVSGATGFIGRELCQQLAARGDTVIAVSRSGDMLPGGSPTRALDLASSPIESDLLVDVDVVFHLAGIAHRHAAAEDYERLNVEATLSLARSAAAAGVGCFVFLSSVKSMGAAAGGELRSEQDCFPTRDPYGLSKLRAECALREEFVDSNMAVVILRSALVYGPEPKGNLRLLALGVRWGLPRPPDGGARSMIALPDLVALLCHLSLQPQVGVRTWIVSGDADYSTREIYDALRQAAGKGRGLAWLPRWGWRGAAWLLDRFNNDVAGTSWDKLFGVERYSNRALVASSGWQPRFQFKDLAADMLAATGGGK